MVENFGDIQGAYNIFKKYNLVGKDNCIFYVVNDESIDFKTIATGVLLGVAINAAGLNVIGVQKNNVNNSVKIAGYLVNQTEKGIGLIPLESDGITDDIRYMKIIDNSYLFIKQENIKSIKVEKKLIHSLDSSIRIITIECTNGEKMIFRAYMKDKYVKYQINNLNEFAKVCGYKESTAKKIVGDIFRITFILLILAIFIVPIIGVIIALNRC